MPDRPATLRDVAAAARVHPATASRALNPETRILVSEDTARRVTDWMLTNLGSSVPMHLVRFHPDYRMTDTIRTPVERLVRDARAGSVMAPSDDSLKLIVGRQILGIAQPWE